MSNDLINLFLIFGIIYFITDVIWTINNWDNR